MEMRDFKCTGPYCDLFFRADIKLLKPFLPACPNCNKWEKVVAVDSTVKKTERVFQPTEQHSPPPPAFKPYKLEELHNLEGTFYVGVDSADYGSGCVTLLFKATNGKVYILEQEYKTNQKGV